MNTLWTILGTFAAVFLGIIVLFVIVCIPHNVRAYRVRRTFRRLPSDVIGKVLSLVQAAASKGPAVTFLRPDIEGPSDGPLQVQSHIGGLPYAEAGDEWPTHDDDRPPRFLLQVLLDDVGLGPVWHGRLIVVFFVFDYEQIVRSYKSPQLDRYVCLTPPEPPFPYRMVTHVRMPAESDESQIPASAIRLCQLIPAIPELLSAHTKDHAGVLAQILRPGVFGYELEPADLIYVSGAPVLIQSPHDPTCKKCGRPMRFLFLFGEVIPKFHMADAGVGYVYGCDEHPDDCQCYVDSH
jgi:Domain of unknown function (DUF1963)